MLTLEFYLPFNEAFIQILVEGIFGYIYKQYFQTRSILHTIYKVSCIVKKLNFSMRTINIFSVVNCDG